MWLHSHNVSSAFHLKPSENVRKVFPLSWSLHTRLVIQYTHSLHSCIPLLQKYFFAILHGPGRQICVISELRGWPFHNIAKRKHSQSEFWHWTCIHSFGKILVKWISNARTVNTVFRGWGCASHNRSGIYTGVKKKLRWIRRLIKEGNCG